MRSTIAPCADLTGVDLSLSQEFAPDGGGGEGFSNIGDVLFTSPQQLEKYFAAARKLADHATIMPGSGVQFSAQRVGLRGPVQVKAQTEQGLYVWYQTDGRALICPKMRGPARGGLHARGVAVETSRDHRGGVA